MKKVYRIPTRKEFRARDDAIAKRLKEIMDQAKVKKEKNGEKNTNLSSMVFMSSTVGFNLLESR